MELRTWVFGSIPFTLTLLTARRSRNAGLSQNSAGFVGALDYGGDRHDARDGSGSGFFRGGAIWACGVFGKMPRRRRRLQQSMYLTISNQGARVE
jgi:hypothetical protein